MTDFRQHSWSKDNSAIPTLSHNVDRDLSRSRTDKSWSSDSTNIVLLFFCDKRQNCKITQMPFCFDCFCCFEFCASWLNGTDSFSHSSGAVEALDSTHCLKSVQGASLLDTGLAQYRRLYYFVLFFEISVLRFFSPILYYCSMLLYWCTTLLQCYSSEDSWLLGRVATGRDALWTSVRSCTSCRNTIEQSQIQIQMPLNVSGEEKKCKVSKLQSITSLPTSFKGTLWMHFQRNISSYDVLSMEHFLQCQCTTKGTLSWSQFKS